MDRARLSDSKINIEEVIDDIIKNMFVRKKPSSVYNEIHHMFFRLHILETTNNLERLTEEQKDIIIEILNKLQSKKYGGFSSAPGCYPNLIFTYFALCCIAIIGSEKAYRIINIEKMKEFLYSLKTEDGCFLTDPTGDDDLRCIYSALVISKFLNLKNVDDLFTNTLDYILLSQKPDGGFGSGLMGESHSGYTYCAVASLQMLNSYNRCNTMELVVKSLKFLITFLGIH